MPYRLQKQPDHPADTPGVQRKDGQAGDVQRDTGTISLRDMTAREIGAVLYRHGLVLSPSRQQVQPRLTELMQDGKIEVVGKRRDSLTKRSVAVYRLVEGKEE